MKRAGLVSRNFVPNLYLHHDVSVPAPKKKLHFAINKTYKWQRVSPRLIELGKDYYQQLLDEYANFSLLLLVLCRPEFILRSSKKYLFSKEKSHFPRPNFIVHVLVLPFFVVNCTAVWLVSGYPKFEKYIIYVTSLYLPRTAAMEDRSSLFTAWTFNSTQLAKNPFLQRLEIRKWVENVCLCLGPYVDCLHTIPHLKVCAVSLYMNKKFS